MDHALIPAHRPLRRGKNPGNSSGPADGPEVVRDAESPQGRAQGLLAAFLAGRRPTTLRTYGIALRDFTRWTGEATVAGAAARLLGGTHGEANRVAQAYVAHLVDRGLAPLTIGVRVAALRALVGLARVQGIVPFTLEVRAPRGEPVRDTRGPGRAGVRAVLDAVAHPSAPREVRDRALLRLLCDLALRRAEVVGIDVEDVDLARGTVAVVGKGRAGRTPLTLPVPTRDAVAAWIAVRGPARGPLFLGMGRGGGAGRLTGTSVARIVRRVGTAAGVPGLRPHGLRHAAITEALDRTRGDLRAVQRYSRHADPRTLLRYDDQRADLAGEVARQVADWG